MCPLRGQQNIFGPRRGKDHPGLVLPRRKVGTDQISLDTLKTATTVFTQFDIESNSKILSRGDTRQTGQTQAQAQLNKPSANSS